MSTPKPTSILLYGLTAGGTKKHELYDVEIDSSRGDMRTLYKKIGSTGRAVDEHLLEMDTPSGQVSIPLPGDIEGLISVVDSAIQCFVRADFEPQAWVSDAAVAVDDGRTSFNAVPALIRMDLAQLKAMFRARNLDALADGLPQRIAHSGPFSVVVDESDVVQMVCLLSGHYGALGENDSVQDLSAPMWDDFCQAANGILSLHRGADIQALATPEIAFEGNVFRFAGTPGEACSVQTSWAHPFEDDAYRLALTLMESQLLALYSAGVLWSEQTGQFNAKVVEAIQTSFDALPRLIEDLDLPFDEVQKAAAHDRPA